MRLGWLFGKKKPRVPLPESRPFDENAFRFSKKFGGETIIEPEHLQEAVGYNEQFKVPEEPVLERKMPKSVTVPKIVSNLNTLPRGCTINPIHIKIEVYQKILSEMEGCKENLGLMQEACRGLENSEYNEENNFEHLKKEMKSAHDKLLQIDKILFKCLGE